jgi:predicted nuclease of predicted toxin-antitoxin system
LRFLIDAQMPPMLAAWLKLKGHDASAVRDLGMRDASDSAIWAHAAADGAIIVTKDEDFAQLAAIDPEGPTVLWVRTGNLVNRLLLARFEHAWPQVEAHLRAGDKIVELR